jgi:CoA:oxalate CoA-transferase
MGGTMSLNGEPGEAPLRMGVSIGDMAGGLYLAIGILAALRARDATGRGQMLDVALTEAQMALCENAIVRRSAFGESPTRMGGRHPLIAPFGPYTSKDGYIVIANVKQWDLFCGLVDRDDLALDERFSSNRARLDNVNLLEKEMNRTMSARTTDEWFEVLRDTNVCAVGKVNSVADLFDDPHVAARNMLVDVPMPYGIEGTLTLPNSPVHLSETPAFVARAMPEHGGDTGDVLHAWLGLGEPEIQELRQSGAIK